MMPARTPVRDKLSINPEEAIIEESEESIRQQQRENSMILREGLAGLPVPKNDFEIVMPEMPTEERRSNSNFIPDAADIDAATQARFDAEAEAERRRQSQAVQRRLPRPSELNKSVIRPTTEQPLSDLQKASLQHSTDCNVQHVSTQHNINWFLFRLRMQ
jgi:pre-mRNA-splicing factor CDC5/CEF1